MYAHLSVYACLSVFIFVCMRVCIVFGYVTYHITFINRVAKGKAKS